MLVAWCTRSKWLFFLLCIVYWLCVCTEIILINRLCTFTYYHYWQPGSPNFFVLSWLCAANHPRTFTPTIFFVLLLIIIFNISIIIQWRHITVVSVVWWCLLQHGLCVTNCEHAALGSDSMKNGEPMALKSFYLHVCIHRVYVGYG